MWATLTQTVRSHAWSLDNDTCFCRHNIVIVLLLLNKIYFATATATVVYHFTHFEMKKTILSESCSLC